ncbi:hypothetical protein B7759_01366 [Burkholderia glumae]|uniref:hypothetical protein n=1 Tax=Burkholderia glumae TaxID=337 RepID=UPI001AE7A81C|nr:hypothetical protein [Burkholderia glumae]QTP32788.1 hypothetical protein B7759_01366 [Burkholderia glumae]
MSKKHEQRTRQQILAKREPSTRGLVAIQPKSRSKYKPHFGKKQAAKIDGSYYAR